MTNLTNQFVSATIYTFVTDLDQSTRRDGVSEQHKQPSLEPAEVFTGVATACRHNKPNPLLHGHSWLADNYSVLHEISCYKVWSFFTVHHGTQT